MEIIKAIGSVANLPIFGTQSAAIQKKAERIGALRGFKTGFIVGTTATIVVGCSAVALLKVAQETLSVVSKGTENSGSEK